MAYETEASTFRDNLKAAIAAIDEAQTSREAIGPDGLSDLDDKLADEIEELLSVLDEKVTLLLTGVDSIDDD